jgi:predicted DNA-binding transcriptional regulator AlpA
MPKATQRKPRQVPDHSASKVMPLSEAAEILHIGRTTAWNLYRRGEFPVPVLKIGGTLRVVRDHLDQYLETGDPVKPGTPMRERVAPTPVDDDETISDEEIERVLKELKRRKQVASR